MSRLLQTRRNAAALAAFAYFHFAAAAFAFNAFPGETLTGNGSIVRSNVGATSEAGEPIASAPGNTMWYSWTAPANGRLTVGTCNQTAGPTTTFDTWVRVFTGSAVNALTSLSSVNNTTGCTTGAGANTGSVVSIAVTSGTTYRIQVDGRLAQTGTFLLHYGLAGLTVNVTDGSATEGGDTASFTVVLNTVPSANVTVSVGTSPQCTRSPTSRTFTPTNWATPQTFTITATNDTLYEGIHSCTQASVTASGDGYTGVTATPPTIIVNDNDPANFTIVKSASAANVTAPGVITYTIVVDNISAGNLTIPVMTDALNQGGSPRTLASGPTLASGDTDGDNRVDATETWTYTATYTVTQSDIDNGSTFSNIATFDVAQSGPIPSNAATTTVTQSPSLSTVKSADGASLAGNVPVGHVVTYTYAVTNSGNVTIADIALSDLHDGLGSPPVPGTETLSDVAPLGDSSDATPNNGVWSSLKPGDTATFTATYTITQDDVDQRQ
ncbi:MAG: hypothetical protein IPL47_02805 [Phyllobacteriaceae bacterium]|nr:hypothetical protein [Phyllobacteriaceae bacterium]